MATAGNKGVTPSENKKLLNVVVSKKPYKICGGLGNHVGKSIGKTRGPGLSKEKTSCPPVATDGKQGG